MKSKIQNNLYKIIGGHLVFWIIYFLFITLLITMETRQPFWYVISNYLVGSPAFLILAYGTDYMLTLRFKKRMDTSLLVIGFFVLSFASAALKLLLLHFLYYGILWPETLEPDKWIGLIPIVRNLLMLWFPVLVLSTVKFMRNYSKLMHEKSEMDREKLRSELSHLKSQLNPHFLFNTLNNLYALSVRGSDKAPEMILRLSEIFHFILYECNSQLIPLSREMELMNNFVELEQLRYGDRLTFRQKLSALKFDAKVPPMMLFTLLENSFKHGSGDDPGKPWIETEISTNSDRVFFIVRNSKPTLPVAQNRRKGIGLENIKSRLRLLYNDENLLQINETDGIYEARLEIPQVTLKY